MTPSAQSMTIARVIVDEHFPNYARQCVQTSVTDLEQAIATALDAQVEQDANVVPDNWLHPWLTGKDALLQESTKPITSHDVEVLLNKIRVTIRQQVRP